jgi:hypothetical protein
MPLAPAQAIVALVETHHRNPADSRRGSAVTSAPCAEAYLLEGREQIALAQGLFEQ